MKKILVCLVYLLACLASVHLVAQSQNSKEAVYMPYDVMCSDLKASEDIMRQAYFDCLAHHSWEWAGKAASNLSVVHYLKGSYDSSSTYIIQALEIYKTNGLQVELGNAYCSYGYQIKRRNIKDAFVYMKNGIAVLEQNQADKALTGAYDNYGVLHELNGALDSAVFFYRKALLLKENLNDSIGLPYSLNNLGGVYLMQNDFDNAADYFERALAIRLKRNDRFGVAESFALLGNLSRQEAQYPQAISWYEQSNSECERIGYPYLTQQNQEQLAMCFEALGNFERANQALKTSAQLKEQLLNEKSIKQINVLEQQYKVLEKDRSIALLNEKAAKRLSWLIGAFALILIASAVFLLVIQRQRRLARQRQDAAIIKERERGLDAVFAATEAERKRIAKDLHDGVGQQLSGLRMGFESLSNQLAAALPDKQKDMEKLTHVIDETCKDVRQISHQMMPKALSESGLIASIEDMLQKSLGLTPIAYRLEHFKVDGERFHEKVELGLYRVCQELINNIIKHSGASEVVVQLFRSKGFLILIVEDNGTGFTKAPENAGIGLANITSRIHTVDGEVSWEPGPQSGTVATVKVPVA
jgi:two-component system, NarL family, sensor kinase